jgi:ribosome-binding factor A
MRNERIASLIEQEISKIIVQDIRDPRLGFVTVIKAVVSPDLKEAVIYFSSLDKRTEALEVLNKARGYIKGILARRIRIRFMPEIHFRLDDSYERGKKIDALLEDISQGDKE